MAPRLFRGRGSETLELVSARLRSTTVGGETYYAMVPTDGTEGVIARTPVDGDRGFGVTIHIDHSDPSTTVVATAPALQLLEPAALQEVLADGASAEALPECDALGFSYERSQPELRVLAFAEGDGEVLLIGSFAGRSPASEVGLVAFHGPPEDVRERAVLAMGVQAGTRTRQSAMVVKFRAGSDLIDATFPTRCTEPPCEVQLSSSSGWARSLESREFAEHDRGDIVFVCGE